jgi:nucleoside-diphosphate-sugar epimerase
MTRVRGATNRKAKQELGWEPRLKSWRDGFLELADPERSNRWQPAPENQS